MSESREAEAVAFLNATSTEVEQMRRGGYWSSGGWSYERDWLQPKWMAAFVLRCHAMGARTL